MLVPLTVALSATAFAQAIQVDSQTCLGNSTPNCGANGTSSPLTYSSYAVSSSGSNHYIVVSVALQAGSSSGEANKCNMAVTYNGSALTEIGSRTIGSNYCKVWLFGARVNSPDGLGHSVVATKSNVSGQTCPASVGLAASAISFTNVSTTTGTFLGATGSSTTMAVSPTSAVGNYIVDAGCNTSSAANSTISTPSSPMARIYYNNLGGSAYNKVVASYRYAANASTTTMTYTVGGTSPEWVIGAVALRQVNGTAIRVDNMAAFDNSGGVRVAWQTGSEVDNLGFHVYRDSAAGRVRLTQSPILGSALLAGSGVSLAAGNRYSFDDVLAPLAPAARYWIEDLDLSGRSTLHGPLPVEPRPGGAALAALAVTTAADSPPPPPAAAEPLVEPPFRAPAIIAPGASHPTQWQVAGARAAKIGVDRDGYYQIRGAELVAAGLMPGDDPRRLALFSQGRAVPIDVAGADDGVLDPEDSVGFYGKRINSAATDTAVYWLTTAAGAGPRIGAARPAATAAAAATGFPATVEWHPRTLYVPALLNGDDDNFFGPLVRSEGLEQTLELPAGLWDPAGPAALEVGLQGLSPGEHLVNVEAAGAPLGEIKLSDRASQRVRLPLAALPADGKLPIGLRAAHEADSSLVEVVRLHYTRRLVARDGELAFSAPPSSAVTLSGFAPGEAVTLLDVTDDTAPQWLPGGTANGNGQLGVVVPAGAATRNLLARAAGQRRAPRFLTAHRTSRLHAGDGAGDLVVIGPAALLPALAPWQRQRTAEGWQVALVDIEDVYDEWSFGIKHPHAIRSFLAHAHTQWGTRPRAVLLVGDATVDPRNFLGRGAFDLMPTKLVATTFIETASDDWFTDFDDDGVADVPVGRLPARSPAEVALIVEKWLAAPVYRSRDEAAAAAPAVFVAGDPDERYDFRAATQATRAVLRPPFAATVIERDLPEGNRAAQLRQALRARPALVTYTGHGSQELWAGGLLSAGNVAALGADGASFFLGLTCLNGFFQDTLRPSLAEALLAHPAGGAFGVFASSSLTEMEWHETLGRGFLRELLVAGATVGEAAARAKALTADPDTRRSWILFADPTWRLRQFPVDPSEEAPLPEAPPPADGGVPADADSSSSAPAPGAGCGCTSPGAPARPPGALTWLGLALLMGLGSWRRSSRPR